MTDVAQLGVHLEETGSSQVIAALNRVESALKGTHESTVAMGAAIGVASGVATAAFNAIASAASGAFGTIQNSTVGLNASLEQATIGFTTLLKSGDAAQTFLTGLQQFAQVTPFEFKDLIPQAQRLMAMGFAARDVIPILRDVGNVTAAMGSGKEGIDRVTLALGQMHSATVVHAQDVNQLIQAGVPAWELLAQATGKSTAEVRQLSEAGKISADVFIAAFRAWSQNNVGDMMEKQSRTFVGAMSNIKDSLELALGKGFQPFFNVIRDMAVTFGDFVQSETFSVWALDLQIKLGALIPTFTSIGSWLMGQLPGAMSAAEAGAAGFVTAVSRIAEVVPPIADTVGATVDRLTGELALIGEAGAGLVTNLHDPLSEIARLFENLAPLVDTARANIGGLMSVIGDTANQFAAFWSGLTGTEAGADSTFGQIINNIISVVYDRLVPGLEAIATTAGTAWQDFRIALTDFWNAATPIAEQLSTWLQDTLPPIIATIQEAWDGFWSHAGPVVQEFWNIAQPIIGAAIGIEIAIVQTALEEFKRIWDSVWGGIQAVLERVAPVIGALAEQFGGAFAGLSDKLAEALRGMHPTTAQAAEEVGTTIRNQIVQGVAPVAADVEAATEPVADSLANVGTHAATTATNLTTLGGAGTTAATGLGTAAKEAQTLDQVMAQLAKSTTPEAVQQALTYQNALAGISEASKNLDLGTAAQVQAMRNAGDVYGANNLALTALGATEEEATRVVYGYASAHDVLAEAAFRATGALREQQAAAAQGPGVVGISGAPAAGPASTAPGGTTAATAGRPAVTNVAFNPYAASGNGPADPGLARMAAASTAALGPIVARALTPLTEAAGQATAATKDHTDATEQGTNAALHGAAALSDFQTNIVSASDANAAMADAFSHGGQKLVAFTAGTGLATNQVVLFGEMAAEAAKVQWAAAVQNAQALREGTIAIAGFKTAVGLTYGQIYGNTATQGTGISGGGGGTNQGIVNLNPGNYFGIPVVSPLTGGTLRGFANGGMVYEPSYIVPTRTGVPSAIMAERGPEAIGGGGGATVSVNIYASGVDALRDRDFWTRAVQDQIRPVMRQVGLLS